jgi:hypothetical protein
MKTIYVQLIAILSFTQISIKVSAQSQTQDSLRSMSYIENEYIKIGVDLNLGGAITYLADKKTGQNMINNYDWGRQIQMSFYSGPVPYEPGDHKAAPDWRYIGWNPIQSGDVAGNRGKIVSQKNNGKTIYIKCIPMHWPLNNVPGECYFESWIVLERNVVKVHSRLVNNRDENIQYPAREQELPALYTNAPFHRLFTYSGEKPFTNDSLTVVKNHNDPNSRTITWTHWQATENWAATLNEADYGLGLWNGNVQGFQGGFYGDSTFVGNSTSKATAYIAPGHLEVLDHNITYDYNYSLIVGNLSQIREYVYHQSNVRNLPAFRFVNDRAHWYYENTTDEGWPIKGQLAISGDSHAAMTSPAIFWKADSATTLLFTAAYIGGAKKSKLYWKPFNQNFDEAHSVEFSVIPDGKYHTYAIKLNNSPSYKGSMAGLKILFNTNSEPQKKDKILVKSIVLSK